MGTFALVQLNFQDNFKMETVNKLPKRRRCDGSIDQDW
jgi:hypothetical protein